MEGFTTMFYFCNERTDGVKGKSNCYETESKRRPEHVTKSYKTTLTSLIPLSPTLLPPPPSLNLPLLTNTYSLRCTSEMRYQTYINEVKY